MFRVAEIYEEAKKIVGICDDTKLFRWMGDAVSMIANKADFEGWKGYLDVCSSGCSCDGGVSNCNSGNTCGRRCLTLPREVETVIGVNIGGRPALGYHQLFSFHLNGFGDCRCPCDWSWHDQGNFHSTYRDLVKPAKLVAYLQTAEDNGKELIVFGYDSNNQLLRRQVSGQWMNGYQVPTIFGVAVPDAEAPLISRITGVFKERTVGSVRLSTIDDSGLTGVTLGIYEPDETLPQYRRIILNRKCNWARIAYLKTNPTFFSQFDHIPLKSRVALLLAIQARKFYAEGPTSIAEAHAFEADAARLELEAQSKAEPPTFMPVQVVDIGNNIRDDRDYDIR